MLSENIDNLFTRKEQQGKVKAALQMIKEFGLSAKEVADKLSIPLSEVLIRMSNLSNSDYSVN